MTTTTEADETLPPRKPRTRLAPGQLFRYFLGVTAFLAALILVLAIATVPRLDSRGRPITRCRNHMRALLPYVLLHHEAMAARAKGTGAPILLALHGHEVPPGREEIFTCPGDPAVGAAVGMRNLGRYDSEDIMDATDDQPLCSFAVRDFARFPLEGKEPQWVLCDREGDDAQTPHHSRGLIVALSNGTFARLSRADLGLAEDEPIIVGPDSPHPELRKMLYLPTD